MKKNTLLILFLSTLWGYSQVKNYTFTQTNGTYNEISGGTSLGSTISDQEYFVDPAVPLGGSTYTGPGFPIGFNFIYNGYTYDRFGVNANGWISLGSSALTPSVNARATAMTAPMTSYTAPTPDALSVRIVPLGKDLQAQANASIRFQMSGMSPNRVLIIQWKNYKRYNSTGDSFNFQIRLRETANTVEFAYGTFAISGPDVFQVGMRAEPSVTVTNFVNRTSTNGWDVTTPGTAVANTIDMSAVVTPSAGLTYKWTPPSCSDPKSLLATNITPTGATLSWSSYLPAPGGYQYTYSTSATLPTGAGTAVTAATANVTGLTADTKYNVFVRSACGTQFTQWVNIGNFKTRCTDVTTFAENFDSYPTGVGNMPDCWVTAGNGTTYVGTGGGSPGTAPNILYMEADATASPAKIGYAIMPPVSNLNSGTYRLKFKVYSYFADCTFDVGYFTNIDDLTTFKILQTVNLPSSTVSAMQEFTVVPPATIPVGIKNLVFRNAGTGTAGAVFTALYIDDVVWQPIPQCADLKNVTVKLASSNSVNLSWDVTGTETAWQYAVSSSTVTDSSTLPAGSFIDVDLASVTVNSSLPNTRTMTVNNLTPNSSSKIWVRSKCGASAFGFWSASPTFLTPCTLVATIHENFDAASTLPDCWRKGNSNGTATVEAGWGSTSSNALKVVSQSTTNPVWLLLPPLSTTAAGYRLKFNFMTSKADTQLQVVSLQDPINIIEGPGGTVTVLKTIPVTSDNASYTTVNEGLTAADPYLAFRILSPSGATTVYIDDVAWEPVPACPDVTAVAMSSITDVSVDLGWTGSGTENNWQYALTNAKVSDPNTLTAVDFVSPFLNGLNATYTFSGLTPSTSYRFWIRSKCSSSSAGVWIGPYYFTTNCTAIDGFSENFDASTDLPSCWSKVGPIGTVAVTNLTGPSSPNVLKLDANTTANAVVAVRPVNFTGDATDVLRFKLSGSVDGAKVEVGYVTNSQNPATFVSLKTYVVASAGGFSTEVADLGYDPASQVLAFRNPGLSTTNSSIYIDDVFWGPASESVLGVDTFNISNLSFRPNPVKDILNISLDREITNVRIVNLLGQQVLNQSNNSKQVKVDMSGLATGAYLVKVTADNQSKTIKVIKE